MILKALSSVSFYI